MDCKEQIQAEEEPKQRTKSSKEKCQKAIQVKGQQTQDAK